MSIKTDSLSSSNSEEKKNEDKKIKTNPYRQPVLSKSDKQFFDDNGYIVIRQAISSEKAAQCIGEMWDFLQLDRTHIEKCYRPPIQPIGFVEMFHSPGMWDNRTNERVYNAFADLWDTDRLWVSIDRCGLKLPTSLDNPDYRHSGFIHWDMDVTTASPLPFQLQGAIALSDTDINMGGFHCCPKMHKFINNWKSKHGGLISQHHKDNFYKKGNPIRVPEPEKTLAGIENIVVPMKAGDLVIWRGELAHGNGENKSDRIRYAQYITMFPVPGNLEPARSQRIMIYKNRTTGGQNPYPQLAVDAVCQQPGPPGDPRQYEAKKSSPDLSDLGKKLLGLTPW